ncbi:CidA/LrgA family protein [Pseudomonas sp. NPDC078700]|uniref:CidA/LrgA family protein n=1 Tax=Pseudomonas sp. NPDC078700 TaxID=3364424 RepID=UPI0037CA86C4
MLLRGLTWLVLFQIVGVAINYALLPALPGAIIGLLLLLVFLLIRGRVDEPLNTAANTLLQYLPLLLVVPATGIIVSSHELLDNLMPIAGALVLSLLVTVPLCGWLMQTLARRVERRADDQA